MLEKCEPEKTWMKERSYCPLNQEVLCPFKHLKVAVVVTSSQRCRGRAPGNASKESVLSACANIKP